LVLIFDKNNKICYYVYVKVALHKIKKGIPSFVELGTIPNFFVLVPTYTVGTIFIRMTKITIIRSIMIEQRYFSDFLITSPPFTFKSKGE